MRPQDLDWDINEDEDVELITLRNEGGPPGATFRVGFAKKSRNVWAPGDLHPYGAMSAMIEAAKDDVPYITESATNPLMPVEWLLQCCAHDPARTAILRGIAQAVRGSA